MATSSGLDNDTRGWILCLVSGAACVVGASVIYVDKLVGLIPGKQNFKIQESNAFLACSLSLSFGVMIYSALCNMLPESKEYLESEGWTERAAGLVLMVLFIGGFIGIQVVSRVLHQFMPSHVVDCDHTHSESAVHDAHGHPRSSRAQGLSTAGIKSGVAHKRGPAVNGTQTVPRIDEAAPLLGDALMRHSRGAAAARVRSVAGHAGMDRRPSMYRVQKRVMSFVKDTKCNCDESGSCYGYTEPCGQECFKNLTSRAASHARPPSLLRVNTGHFHQLSGSVFQPGTHGHHADEHADDANEAQVSPHFRAHDDDAQDTDTEVEAAVATTEEEEGDDDYSGNVDADLEAQHHHHVPTNAFLSIGLQTSIAIALHKFPEGFITFATNHANPDLGFNVFMALFVHNITEGFAMCLPLYLALGSRMRAMGWSAVLGGLSQPLGAGIAALWFGLARRTNMAPGPIAYASLFAVTAGIMVSVALQLFVEGLSLNHNRSLCIFFGFIGMALMGLSNGLFAAH